MSQCKFNKENPEQLKHVCDNCEKSIILTGIKGYGFTQGCHDGWEAYRECQETHTKDHFKSKYLPWYWQI